jgi:DNA-directed RNA polymerase specialized sigma subunit
MAKKPARNYLSNHNLLEQMELSKQQNKMTDELSKMVMLLCERIANRPNFAAYTYIDDMKSYALLNIVKNWRSFDATKSSNVFSYLSTYIFNSFIQYLKAEKKQRNIRDSLLVHEGLDPSRTFAEDYKAQLTENHVVDSSVLFNPAEVMFAPSEHHDNVED